MLRSRAFNDGDVLGSIDDDRVGKESEKLFEPKAAQPSSSQVIVGQFLGPSRHPRVETDRHGEISVVDGAFETVDGLECLGCPDCLFVALLDEIVEVVDDVTDPRNTVPRTILLNWSIPCRYG